MIRDKGIEPKVCGVEVISDVIVAKGVKEAAKETLKVQRKY